MNADLKQQIEDVLAEWRNSDDDLFSFEETCGRMAALLQELVDAQEALPATNPSQISSSAELPAWENGDDPLIGGGLISRGVVDFAAVGIWPSKPAPEAEPVAYFTGYNNGYPTIAPINSALCMAIGTALYSAPPAPSVPDVLPATNPSQISSFTEPVEWLPGGFRIEHFTKDDPMLTDEANAERRFFVTRIESPYPKDGVWFGATAGAALAKACAALGIEYADALAGVSTEHLEQYGLPDFAQKISDLAQQRDKLLAALEKCRDMVGHPDNVAFINTAIAEVKGPK